MIDRIDHWLTEKTKQYAASSIYLPADSMSEVLCAHWRRSPHPMLARLVLYQIDDIAEGERAGALARFFREKLPHYAVHRPCVDVQADLAILGFGVNGHVAFHEPGIPETFRYGTVTLCDGTADHLGVKRGTKAVTFGLGAFLRTKAVLLVVRGEGKQHAYERFLARDPAIPASALHKHSDLTVLADL